jgi:hypothetical protein
LATRAATTTCGRGRHQRRHTETGATVTFTAFADENASLFDLDTGQPYAAPVELDDGLSDAAAFLHTNGAIVATELGGDMLAGTLSPPRAT